jgi:hypothetical protein
MVANGLWKSSTVSDEVINLVGGKGIRVIGLKDLFENEKERLVDLRDEAQMRSGNCGNLW